MKFLKKSILGAFALCALLPISNTYAAKTGLVNVDFEDTTYEDFAALDNVTIMSGISTDSLTIAEESTGNSAFRFFREESEVANNSTKLGFNYKLPQTLTSGKATVSFKMKYENSFRSRWRDIGSALTSSGEKKLFLFTHDKWIYATNTGTWNSITIDKVDVWCDVKYELDIDNNMATITVEMGNSKKTSTITGPSGDFDSLEFTVGYQNPTWQAAGSGDLIYWIDDIKVVCDSINVESTSIDGNERAVKVDEPISIVFDEDISDSDLTSANFVLKCDGKSIAADIKKTNDKKVSIEPKAGFDYNTEYSLTVNVGIKKYSKEFKTISVIDCNIKNNQRVSGSVMPTVTKTDGITYNAVLSFDDGDFEDYDFSETLTEPGKYILKITATDTNGKKQEAEIAFVIISELAPVIDGKVTISGNPIFGDELVGAYTFFDENGDEQDMDKTAHKWYRIHKDGSTELIAEGTLSYVLTEDDEDCYIKFTVIPYSKREPYAGDTYESEKLVGPMNPTVENIAILGKAAEGEELSVTYDYYDENGDEEIIDGDNKTVIAWYCSAAKDSGYEKIAEGASYTLTSDENDKYIKVGIVPKNGGSGKQETEFFSEYFAGAFAPTAVNVSIIGTLKVGNVVGVSYNYLDENGDEEGSSVIKWFVADKEVSTGESYTITQSDAGKTIYVSVTPYSKELPYEGQTVKSTVGTITAKKSESYSSGGSSGDGGGSYSSSGTISGTTVSGNTTESSQGSALTGTVSQFNDISGHWAEAEIKLMADAGILQGKGNGLFMPNEYITRAELAAIIAKAYSLEDGENIFTDVSEDDWFSASVSAVASYGYMNGYSGLFRPYDSITRQEMAVVLKNLSQGDAEIYEKKEFSDSEQIADWAADAVDYAVSCGLMRGVSEDMFAPKGIMTRAQAAVIMARITK